MSLRIVIFGLSITSSWGNGHATTYRSLVKGLAARGHSVTFAERDVPWYRDNRDMRDSPHCSIALYEGVRELSARFGTAVAEADLVIVGSYVPDGIAVGDWVTRHARGVTAFYDIDTPVTLARLESGACEYLSADLVRRYGLYLSFTGGPVLSTIERRLGSPRARALYCAADPDLYKPVETPTRWGLGYLGTYSADRQPALDSLLLAPARRLPDERFAVAGPQYPQDIAWPANVDRADHLPPAEHAAFYCGQRFTLNVTRADMVSAGYSPSVRLFEAAACGVPIISDRWPGLESFLKPGEEVLLADGPEDVRRILLEMPDARRRAIAAAGRTRILEAHTPEHRAKQLEEYYGEARAAERRRRQTVAVA